METSAADHNTLFRIVKLLSRSLFLVVAYIYTYGSRYFVPSFLQSKHSRVGEGSTNLQNSIKVVHTSADVCHGSPLLDGSYPRRHVAPADWTMIIPPLDGTDLEEVMALPTLTLFPNTPIWSRR